MSRIQNFPEEILRLILSEAYFSDLRQCQLVCRSWYSPAHVLRLKLIVLHTLAGIKKFIACFDRNPKPVYFNAVQQLQLSIYKRIPSDYRLSKRTILKLFSQFPNLKEVHIDCCPNLLANFNDEICQQIKSAAPNLEEFSVNIDDEEKQDAQYLQALYNVRLLLTTMYSEDLDLAVEYSNDPVEFLSRFPQLDTVLGDSIHLDNFEDFLPVLQRLPHLKSIQLAEGNDRDNFAENCFAGIPKKQQKALIERLSKVDHYEWFRRERFCHNATAFASKYLTGLKRFNLNSPHNMDWTDMDEQVFCGALLDLFCSVTEDAAMFFDDIKFKNLSRCFPSMADKVFQQAPPTHKHITLNLHLTIDFPKSIASLLMKTNLQRSRRKISIMGSFGLGMQQIMKSIFAVPMDKVTVFILKIDRRLDYKYKVDVNLYDKILAAMPSLKKIIVDIPGSFVDKPVKANQKYKGVVASKVENLTLRPGFGMDIQTLLDRYFFAFPNMKHLTLQYYCGALDQDMRKFDLKLSNYSLKTLEVDITPVTSAIGRRTRSRSLEDEYFVLELNCDNQRHAFKISLDLSSVSRYGEDNEDDDYYRVHVQLASLGRLVLCTCVWDGEELNYFS